MSRRVARRLATILALLVPIVRSASAGDAPKGRPTIAITASPAILPSGASCRVVLQPEEKEEQVVKVAYEGTIVRSDDGGVLLLVSQERREVVPRRPALNYRLFRNIGIGHVEPGDKLKEVWLPAESIQSVALRPNPEKKP